MLKLTSVHISLAVIISVASGCALFDFGHPSQRSRQLVQEKRASFNPAYFKDRARQHRAIPFNIVNGELELSSRPIEDRPGPLPYRPPGVGGVVVVYKDSEGQEIGRFAMADPTRTRSCDFKARGRTGERKPVMKGRVDILVPVNDEIVVLEFVRQTRRFDLRER